MYIEVKLVFFIYLWYPKTKVQDITQFLSLHILLFLFSINFLVYFVLFQGTTFVYDNFFRPFIVKHESDIDRNMLELRTRAGDFAVLYCQKAVSYGQTRFFEILHYVASQSNPEPQSGRSHLVQVSTSKDP